MAEPVIPVRHAVFLEVAGAGGAWSMNVERSTPSERLLRLGLTAGAITNYDNITNGERAVIATAGRLFRVSVPGGQPDTPIEIAGGVVLGEQWRHQSGSNRDDGGYAALVGSLGLRTSRRGPGFYWRLTFTPFLNFTAHNDQTRTGFQPSAGGSLGWLF